MSEHTEQFDEDNLRLDPLEEGMDPPEHWAQADKFGNTERELREGESLDDRLAQEQPEPEGEPAEAVDETGDVETLVPDEPSRGEPGRAVRQGTSADEAGGSVAEELRSPPSEPE